MSKVKYRCISKVGEIKKLFYLQLHITEKCNLRCKHCYEGFSDNCSNILLTPEEIAHLIIQYRDFLDINNYKGKIYFTGGEPVLDPNLCSYISQANNLGLCTMILSNGTLIDKNKARQLKDSGLKIAQISIDGLDKTHDEIRGVGSFIKATEALDNCHGVGLITTVMITLSKMNMNEIEGIINHCIQHKVTRFSFGRLVPTGNGIELMDQLINKDELHQLFKRIKKIKKQYQYCIEFALHDPLWLTYMDVQNTCGCSAGIHGLCVIENGDIMPCRRLDLAIGNIRHDSLQKIWNSNYLCHFRNRDNYEGKCRDCKYLRKCGGCRAIAKVMTLSEFGEDPQCFMRR